MRTLLVATAVILSLSAAGAQEMVPANSGSPAAQQSNDRAFPAQAQASPGIIEQLKAAGELKDEPKRLEAPAPKLADEVKPADTTPAQAAAPKPAEPPVIAKPAEVRPEATPAPKVVDTRPVETKTVETKPAEATATTRPVKKKVVRKRETDEQKARRIAAKYGISW